MLVSPPSPILSCPSPSSSSITSSSYFLIVAILLALSLHPAVWIPLLLYPSFSIFILHFPPHLSSFHSTFFITLPPFLCPCNVYPRYLPCLIITVFPSIPITFVGPLLCFLFSLLKYIFSFYCFLPFMLFHFLF